YQILKRRGLSRTLQNGLARPETTIATPGCWSSRGDGVIFSAVDGDAQNIWELSFSKATRRFTGSLTRLTVGSGEDANPSCASTGAVAFSNLAVRYDIWLQPFDLARGAPQGRLDPIGVGVGAGGENPALSADGKTVTFVSEQSGRVNVWK